MKREDIINTGKITRAIISMTGVQFHQINKLPGMNHIKDYYHVLPFGDIWSDFKGDILKTLRSNTGGYPQVRLVHSNGDVPTYHVHRIIGLLKHGRPPANGEQCMHLDGDNCNNRLENIDYGSAKENASQYPDPLCGPHRSIASARGTRMT